MAWPAASYRDRLERAAAQAPRGGSVIHSGWRFFQPGLYLGVHLIEGETVTPMLLAKRFTLNRVLVIVSLVSGSGCWILSVPMLATTKIVCDRVQPLAAFGDFLEG
jgi:predicted PurR-regulated permease PerM